MPGELGTASNQEDGDDRKCQENWGQQVTKRTEMTASVRRTEDNKYLRGRRGQQVPGELRTTSNQEEGEYRKCQEH